jgi:hypothetical protein
VTTGQARRWFFVHMHKTAGTALAQRLRHEFPPEAVYPTVADQQAYLPTLQVDLLRRSFEKHGDRLRLITGHFPLCTTERLGVPFATMTVLRDPVERTLSALRDMREHDEAFRDQPLEEIYADPVRFQCLIHNHMVKMLSMTPDEMTDGVLTVLDLDSRYLERAKRNLVERVDAWGVQEHFDEFCDELVQRFGWDLGPPRIANASRPFEAEDTFCARIARDNALDVELYRFALELRGQHSTALSG